MNIKELLKKRIYILYERVKNIKKRTIYCILAGFILSIITLLTSKSSIYIRPNEIERGSYGTQKTPYSIRLDAENLAKNMEVDVQVSPKKYTIEEANKKFEEKFEALLIDILGKNESFENINEKLNFKFDLGDGIRADYSFSPKRIDELYEKYETRKSKKKKISSTSIISTESDIDDFAYFVEYQKLVDGSGNVNNADFKASEFCTGYIEIQMSTDVKGDTGVYKSQRYMIPIRVISKKLTPRESFIIEFKKQVEEYDKNTVDNDTLILPKVVNDFRIIYKDKKDLSFLLMPIIGFIASILLNARDNEKIKDEIKKQKRMLEIDFSQIITKILLYVSSGMTIRNSFIRLAEQYQKAKNENETFEKRKAYEEIVIVKNKLNSGYSEINAYEEMAKNINLRPYTRFLNIIIQSIKNGNKDLKNILNMEVQDALYERKQNAKILGEEATTKLVLPLMIMLSIIMVVIMVPAFMGM